MNSAMTNQQLGRIPLVPGMPVVFTVNFDVEDGIVNRTVGTLQTIYYYRDNDNRQHATACIVNVPKSANAALPSLTRGVADAKHGSTIPCTLIDKIFQQCIM